MHQVQPFSQFSLLLFQNLPLLCGQPVSALLTFFQAMQVGESLTTGIVPRHVIQVHVVEKTFF